MTEATSLMEKRLLDLASLMFPMFVMIGSLSSSFTIAFCGLPHSPGAKLSINNGALSLPRPKDHFAGFNVCRPRPLRSSKTELQIIQSGRRSGQIVAQPARSQDEARTACHSVRNPARARANTQALAKRLQAGFLDGLLCNSGVAITAHRIAATARSLNLVIVDFLHVVDRMLTI